MKTWRRASSRSRLHSAGLNHHHHNRPAKRGPCHIWRPHAARMAVCPQWATDLNGLHRKKQDQCTPEGQQVVDRRAGAAVACPGRMHASTSSQAVATATPSRPLRAQLRPRRTCALKRSISSGVSKRVKKGTVQASRQFWGARGCRETSRNKSFRQNNKKGG